MTIENIIKSEVFTNCSQLVRQLSEENISFVESHFSIFIRDDFSEPPEGYEVVNKGDHGYVWFNGEDESENVFTSFTEAVQDAFEDSGDEPPTDEALEHWIVSDWLADKLEQVGACIDHDVYGLCIWGRTESGQSLTMDSDLKAVQELVDRQIEQAMNKG